MARFWFRPRRYGYGATPVTWEGWALTVGIAAVVALSVVAMYNTKEEVDTLAASLVKAQEFFV